jgi:glucokinase
MTAVRRLFLVGDIGATNARLAITARTSNGIEWVDEARRADADFPSLDAAIDALFAQSSVERDALTAACFGIAGPIQGRRARFTNRDWVIDANVLATKLGVPVTLVNDLEAAAKGIDGLPRSDLAVLQRGSTTPDGVRLIIGAGTGLGVAYAIPCGDGHRIVASEGGHVGFAPQGARQRQLFDALVDGGHRVDAEYVASGAGLERIFATLVAERPDRETAALRAELEHGPRAAAIGRFAVDGADPLASGRSTSSSMCGGIVGSSRCASALPVRKMIGMLAVAASAFSAWQTSKPDTSGISMSSRIRSGRGSAKAFSIAVVTNERLGLIGATLLASESLAESRRRR